MLAAERRLFGGIDGGQSATTAVITGEGGELLGRGEAGPCDHVDEGADSRRCAQACETALARALTASGLAASTPLEAIVIGISGYDGEFHGVRPHLPSTRVRFVHDAPIALAGAVELRPAVVVIAGTGSVAYGEDAAGVAVRVGGYGYLFGDAGSGFVLARDALALAMSDADRGQTTRLGNAALAYFDLPDLRALARAFYLRDISRPALASFARVVMDAARLGDDEANGLVDGAAAALALLAASAVERLGLQDATVPIALAGGLFVNPEFYRRTAQRVAASVPNARVMRPSHDPAIGAARLAMSTL